MTKVFKIVYVYAAALATACASSGAAGPEVVVSLERFRDCLGCSAYRLEFYPDGRVVYEGTDLVKMTGRHVGRTSADKMALITRTIRDMGFMTLKDQYIEQGRPVQGKTRITVTLDGQTKTTLFAYSQADVNVRLTSLARLINEAADAKQWVCPVRLGDREFCGLD
jgi:hypothetical protein